jgi:hypothetical protein
MAEKNLRNRSIAAVGKELVDSREMNLSENLDTDCVQITNQVAASEVLDDTTAKDLGVPSQEINMSVIQWHDILASLKQVIQTEIRKETEKLTAVLEARLTTVSESLDAKLNLVCENLKEDVKGRVEGIASEIKAVSTAILADKQNTVAEFQKVNLVISQIEVKIAGSTTPHHSSLVRAEGGSQSNCKTTGLLPSWSKHANSIGVNGVSTCSASAYAASLINVSESDYTENVSAISVVTPNGCNNLEEFSLPKFKNSAKQVVTQFPERVRRVFCGQKNTRRTQTPALFQSDRGPVF